MKDTINRLNRVIGQLNWIIKMIEKGEDCSKIIIQFQAAKAAIESTFSKALSDNLLICIKEKNPEDIEKILKLITKN